MAPNIADESHGATEGLRPGLLASLCHLCLLPQSPVTLALSPEPSSLMPPISEKAEWCQGNSGTVPAWPENLSGR